MANTFKFGNGNWATKEDSVLAYNDENNNFKPLPFDFTRASTATYVDSDGLIKTARNGEARIDYTDNTKGALSLEPQRSNLINYSEEFSNASVWGKVNTTFTDDETTSPSGLLTGKLTRNVTTFSCIRDATISTTLGSTYVFSAFYKKDTETTINHSVFNENTGYVTFNFDTETISITRNDSGNTIETDGFGFEKYENGWYRVYLKFVKKAGSVQLQVARQDAGVIGQSTFIYGAQLEQGSYATSYIPTSGSAVTRVVDAIEQSGFQGKVMNATQGTIFIHFNNPIEDGDNNDFHMFRSEGTSGIENGFLFKVDTGTGVDILERVLNATGAQFGNIVVKGQENKIAISFTSSTLLGSGNGVTKSYAGTYLGTKINIDEFQNSGATLQGFDIIDMKFYDTALTQEEINALTS